jgi:hypothetical protein
MNGEKDSWREGCMDVFMREWVERRMGGCRDGWREGGKERRVSRGMGGGMDKGMDEWRKGWMEGGRERWEDVEMVGW